MKLSTLLFSTAATQASHRESRSMPADGNELFEYEANDRSSSHDYSSQYIESMTRYLISAAQTRENGGDSTDWWVLHDSAGLKATVKEMLEYGCWRQVLNEIQGYGEPVDSFDQLAKDWRHCRACTQIDNDCPKRLNIHNTYHPFSQEGLPAHVPAYYRCLTGVADFNDTICKVSICECDVHFATEIATLYLNGERVNPAHHGSDFDHAAQCGTPPSSGNTNGGSGIGRPGPAKLPTPSQLAGVFELSIVYITLSI